MGRLVYEGEYVVGFLSPWCAQVRRACSVSVEKGASSSSEESEPQPVTSRRRIERRVDSHGCHNARFSRQLDTSEVAPSRPLMSMDKWRVVAATATLWVDPPSRARGGHWGRSYKEKVSKGTIGMICQLAFVIALRTNGRGPSLKWKYTVV